MYAALMLLRSMNIMHEFHMYTTHVYRIPGTSIYINITTFIDNLTILLQFIHFWNLWA